MKLNDNFREDYNAVLEVSAGAGSDEIRAAYLRKVKEHPPDRSPLEFERIREAYEMLRNPKYRIFKLMNSTDSKLLFHSLQTEERSKRNFVGPKLWLEALKQK